MTNNTSVKFITLLYSIFFIILIEIFASLIIASLNHHLIVIGFSRLIQIFLILFIVIHINNGLNTIGLSYNQIIPGIKKGHIWSFIFGIITLGAFCILLIWFDNPLALISSRQPNGFYYILCSFIVGGIIAPVCEEIFFRGILYGFFKRVSVPLAICLSTLFFVILHPVKTSIPVPQIVGGFIFAISYELTGMLMVPITIHILGNTAIFSISFIYYMNNY